MSLYNIQAESGLLAAFIRHPDSYEVLNESNVIPSDFMGPQQRKIAEAMASVGPDIALITEKLEKEEDKKLLEELALTPVSPDQAKEYASIVKGLSMNRKIGNLGADIVGVAQKGRANWRESIADVDALYRLLSEEIPDPGRSPRPSEILQRMAMSYDEKIIPINWSETLNYKTGGFRPGMYWVIGGFSSTGKSAVACNIALDVLSEPNHKVMIVSAEMSQEQYMIRLLSILSGISQYDIRDRVTIGHDQANRLQSAKNRIANSNLLVYDDLYTMDAIRSEAKRVKAREGLDVLIVDFHQNITISGDEVKDAREVAIQLQRLAKEIQVCVVDFSQVSNAMAQQDSQEKGLGDFYTFKGSGAIRDAADVAIMLRRDRRNSSPALRFQIAKNRHGAVGEFTTVMDLATGKIYEPKDDWA